MDKKEKILACLSYFSSVYVYVSVSAAAAEGEFLRWRRSRRGADEQVRGGREERQEGIEEKVQFS